MTIVGIAHVSGITTISREDTHPIVRPVEVHPAWCQEYGNTRPACGGNHLGEAVDIVATAGGFQVIDGGALVPRVSISPATQDGAPAVLIALFEPTAADFDWAEVNLSPAAARELAAALEAGRAARVRGMNRRGLVWLAVPVDEPATVTVVDPDRAVLVSARLHAHEVTALPSAITSAAELVEQDA